MKGNPVRGKVRMRVLSKREAFAVDASLEEREVSKGGKRGVYAGEGMKILRRNP